MDPTMQLRKLYLRLSFLKVGGKFYCFLPPPNSSPSDSLKFCLRGLADLQEQHRGGLQWEGGNSNNSHPLKKT